MHPEATVGGHRHDYCDCRIRGKTRDSPPSTAHHRGRLSPHSHHATADRASSLGNRAASQIGGRYQKPYLVSRSEDTCAVHSGPQYPGSRRVVQGIIVRLASMARVSACRHNMSQFYSRRRSNCMLSVKAPLPLLHRKASIACSKLPFFGRHNCTVSVKGRANLAGVYQDRKWRENWQVFYNVKDNNHDVSALFTTRFRGITNGDSANLESRCINDERLASKREPE